MAQLCAEAERMHTQAHLGAPQAYQNYVQTILTRNNTITGVLYKDDPTIMAVELAANPHTRCGTALHMSGAWHCVAFVSPLVLRLHAGPCAPPHDPAMACWQ